MSHSSRSKASAASVVKVRLKCEALEARNAPSDMLSGISGIAGFGESNRLWLSDLSGVSDGASGDGSSSPSDLVFDPIPLDGLTVSSPVAGPATESTVQPLPAAAVDPTDLVALSVTAAVPVAAAGPISASGGNSVTASGTAAAPSQTPDSGGFVPLVAGLSPAKIHTAYGFTQISSRFNGKGITIAIVDAYNANNIQSDMTTFNTEFGLQQFNGTGDPTFKVVSQTGTGTLPSNNTSWAGEIALDVEWSHAMAPEANILLVEASSSTTSSFETAINYASAHASVVSMSWGGSETSSPVPDSYFEHVGVAYTASAGDDGAGVINPASSPYVIGVGGTTLNLNSSGVRTSETAWADSGGGISSTEAEPEYQLNYRITTAGNKRGVPDVAWDANPNTGVSVYSSPNGGWQEVGGTSVGAPSVAGLIADADSVRLVSAEPMLTTDSKKNFFYDAASTPALYAADFYDVTSGSNGSSSIDQARVGYDFVTGLGVPNAANILPFLATYSTV